MLSYVFVMHKYDKKKVPCSLEQGNLPDFSAIGLTCEDYEQKLKQYDAYIAYREEEGRNRDAYEELFYGNIELFMQHLDKILQAPKYANIMLPGPLFGAMYINFDNREVTLGEFLQILKNEEPYSRICPECKGKMYLLRFGFSPFSGRVFPTWRCTGECKQTFHSESLYPGANGNKLRDLRMKYAPIPSLQEPTDIVELLNHLGVKVESVRGHYVDNMICGFSIGGSKSIISLVQNTGGAWDIKEDNSIKMPEQREIVVPQKCWTYEFVTGALLPSGFPFGLLPLRYRNQEFIDKAVAETDWVPNIGEISPKLLTVDICVKAIKGNPNKRYRLLKLVPEHLKEVVLERIQ